MTVSKRLWALAILATALAAVALLCLRIDAQFGSTHVCPVNFFAGAALVAIIIWAYIASPLAQKHFQDPRR
jgi:hypothetical protein